MGRDPLCSSGRSGRSQRSQRAHLKPRRVTHIEHHMEAANHPAHAFPRDTRELLERFPLALFSAAQKHEVQRMTEHDWARYRALRAISCGGTPTERENPMLRDELRALQRHEWKVYKPGRGRSAGLPSYNLYCALLKKEHRFYRLHGP